MLFLKLRSLFDKGVFLRAVCLSAHEISFLWRAPHTLFCATALSVEPDRLRKNDSCCSQHFLNHCSSAMASIDCINSVLLAMVVLLEAAEHASEYARRQSRPISLDESDHQFPGSA